MGAFPAAARLHQLPPRKKVRQRGDRGVLKQLDIRPPDIRLTSAAHRGTDIWVKLGSWGQAPPYLSPQA